MFWLGAAAGLVVGANVGLFVAALLGATKKSEAEERMCGGTDGESDNWQRRE